MDTGDHYTLVARNGVSLHFEDDTKFHGHYLATDAQKGRFVANGRIVLEPKKLPDDPSGKPTQIGWISSAIIFYLRWTAPISEVPGNK